MFGILGIVLESGMGLEFWKVFWILGVFCILESVCRFWLVLLDSGKCFWILASVFGFWQVFLDFGKFFVPMGHRN